MKKIRSMVVLLCMVGAGLSVLAQVDTATLVGTVKDRSGAVIAGATATATSAETGKSISVKTEADGNFVITPLKIGSYSVAIEASGFKKEVRQNIVLNVQQTARLDFKLEIGSVSEEMMVTAAPPLLETESASLGDVVTGQEVRQLPLNGRRYTDLATLTAGVTKVTEGPVNGSNTPTNGNAGGNFSVNGTRGDQNNFILDGIDNNSNDNGDVAVLSSVDAIAEFKVQTSNYSAEFGRSGGAVINASTRSGANKFHGSAWEFLRNDALDARQYFESSDQPKAPYKQNQFGATFGGPIVKDKAFFFVDYEGTRIHSAQTDFATVPSVAERTGDFSDILGDQIGSDALGRPIYAGEIYNPATTRDVNGTMVRDGLDSIQSAGFPSPGRRTSSLRSISTNWG